MSRLIWTRTAQQAIVRLHRFLADHDPPAARRAIKAIRTGVDVLVRQPRLGRPVDELDTVFREWLIDFGDSGYVVMYRVDDDGVTILTIRHQREAGY
ncbi:plasmid stabilization protein [Burkholderia sp. HI2761]|uniref:type II toxin-antitoxin system RelE/ParE family toxin n=1 Tax=unclassified Burkholderia TaxID=2613784 RepID=UPI000B7A7994|nr:MULTISPECIES: type II toxin-antitoxin system RelE/ParE family toxin [unclassified Burkholderia]MPV56810.1 type II toxin-antitoxin system RelE/ParE family toxin [Burkholderia sp. BE24]OXJ24794.1 plasmid stabilization protein [Burkholderia sp. HI2761]